MYQIYWTTRMMSNRKTWRLHKQLQIFPRTQGEADVEMEEENRTPGFEPKFSCSGYDINLVRPSYDTVPGATSPVTAREGGLLDEETPQAKAPGMGRLGSDENPGHPITKKK